MDGAERMPDVFQGGVRQSVYHRQVRVKAPRPKSEVAFRNLASMDKLVKKLWFRYLIHIGILSLLKVRLPPSKRQMGGLKNVCPRVPRGREILEIVLQE